MLHVIEGAPEDVRDGARKERWFAELDHELRAFVRSRVAPASADDVVQDALLRIVRGLDRVRDAERLGPWAYTVARSTVTDHYRRRARAGHPEEELEDSPDDDDASDSHEFAPAARILAAWLPGAIEALPDPYRSTLRETELEGTGHAALAAREGVSVSAIKSRVSRGRAKLRAAAERCCEVTRDARGAVIGLRARQCGCKIEAATT